MVCATRSWIQLVLNLKAAAYYLSGPDSHWGVDSPEVKLHPFY